MATKKEATIRDVRSLTRKHLGKESADAVLNKIDKLVKQGATPRTIDKAVTEHLSKHTEKVRGILDDWIATHHRGRH